MSKIEEAIFILEAFGLPRAQRNDRSALTLLALLNLKQNSPWSAAETRSIRIHSIIEFAKSTYGKSYAENTRETIRRQTLHQFEQAGIVVINSDNPRRPTNSPNSNYRVSDEALGALRKYGSPDWESALEQFIKLKGRLVERYEKQKQENLIPANLPDGNTVYLSPGEHNELQRKILEKFRASFCPISEVVYVGDTARKMLHCDEARAEELQIPLTQHDKLPDVILYDRSKNLLFLVEAVTAHGPMSAKRQIELEEMLKNCKAKRIYVSAFPDFHEFKKHIDNIAWETEVWIEKNPKHMIHYNGPKFLTIYGD